MSEYTPTTEQVRFAYAADPEAEYRNPVDYPGYERENKRAFDRWLAAHDAEGAAHAVEVFAADLQEWYPDDLFPKPTDENYHNLHVALARSNITLDRFSADLMRRAAGIAVKWAADLRSGGTRKEGSPND